MFQPRLVTAPNLGSVTNATSKLNPVPPLLTVSWIFCLPSPFCILMPLPSATFGMSFTALLRPIIPLHLWAWIACPPGKTTTPIVLHLPSLRYLPCLPRPAPQHLSSPLNPRAACPFMPPLPPSVCSHFAILNMASAPVDPCG